MPREVILEMEIIMVLFLNNNSNNNNCCRNKPHLHYCSKSLGWEGDIVNSGFGVLEKNSTYDIVYVGTYFKPYAYINHYMHGDFTASAAAAKLAALSSEESRLAETYKAANGRVVSSDILL